MTDKIFKIFVDFDGTISTQDIGEAIVYHFGDAARIKEILKDWIDNKITSPESWYLMFDTMKDFTRENFKSFIEGFHIDPTFPAFVEYCRSNNFEIRVLSDGYDLYINHLLQASGLDNVEVYCNHLDVDEQNRINPIFPYGDAECKLCGNCKRNHILSNSGDDEYTFYIGDGYSDRCPIQYCDFIFAKNDLLKYCEVNRITYFPFNDFGTISKKLDELKSKKRLKKKHQAELKRREVFLQG